MSNQDHRESLYEILEVDSNASLSEIRKSYQSLILRHHPDKSDESDRFVQIDKAWKILRDEVLRKKYDAESGQQDYAEVPIVNETLPKEELDFDSESGIYERPCRCGGSYSIDKDEIEEMDSSFYINCTECSLVIEILIKGHG